MEPWYIYGAGGLGVETMDILRDAIAAGAEAAHDIHFVEDNATRSSVCGLPVCGIEDCAPGAKVTIAVGEPAVRGLLLQKVQQAGLTPASIISPRAFVSPYADIAEGVIVAPLCSVQARAKIARNAAINTMAIVGHDVAVGEGAVVSSMVNLGGGVTVGAAGYVGMGALVKEGLSLGLSSIIGMGSVVYKDIPDEMIALGNPARVARRNEDKKVFS